MNTTRTRDLLLGVILALLFLGFGLDRLGYMAPVRALVQTLIRPAQATLTDAASQAGDLTRRRESLAQLQTDNARLQAEVNRLLVENIRLQELERENRRLRDLLNYAQNNPGFDVTAAGVKGRVIGADPGNLLYTIFIDVGAKDGVARDMPVVTDRGLAGRIVQVGPSSAQVLLIIDPASSVNVLIQNSRVQGIIKGELGGTLIMERIPQGETVVPGDLVLTS
ncbi:MAG: rod shape-determining protein MreC, partial [Anaerolineae bacterium]